MALEASFEVTVRGVCVKCGRERTAEEVIDDGVRLLEDLETARAFVECTTRCACGATRVRVNASLSVK